MKRHCEQKTRDTSTLRSDVAQTLGKNKYNINDIYVYATMQAEVPSEIFFRCFEKFLMAQG